MKLSEEQLGIIISKLKMRGMAGDFPNTSDAIEFIQSKHYSRYLDLISFARHKQINTSWASISRIYRIDLVFRRMIDERLKPIELEMKTKLMHYLEFNNLDISDFEELKLFEDYSQVESVELRKKQRETINFVKASIEKIVAKNPKATMNDIINEFSLGQTAALISILDSNAFKIVFPNVNQEKDKFARTLVRIVDLRNHIAHLKTILTLTPICQNRHSTFMIKQLLQDLKMVGKGDIVSDLKVEFSKYQNNCLQKIHDGRDSDVSVDQLVDIFEKVKVFIF